MRVRFARKELEQLEAQSGCPPGYAPEIMSRFRRCMQFIRAAVDIRDFYALKSLHFEKLKGSRRGQHSMRLNRQFRLVVELEPSPEGTVIVVVAIEDYH